MVAVAAKGLGTGEGWFERGQGAHLPARRASKDPPTVTSVGERQRRARAGAAFLAGRRRDMARNDLKLGGITLWPLSQCVEMSDDELVFSEITFRRRAGMKQWCEFPPGIQY